RDLSMSRTYPKSTLGKLIWAGGGSPRETAVSRVDSWVRVFFAPQSIRYGQSARFFDCRNSNITLWRRDQRTIRRNHVQQVVRLSGSQRWNIGGRVRRLFRRCIFAPPKFSRRVQEFPCPGSSGINTTWSVPRQAFR